MNRIVSLVKWLTAAALVLSAGQALAAWKVRYDYSEGDDRGVAVATDASGNIYALVASEGDDNEAVVIVSYNQSGNELETWEYDPEDYDDYVPSCFVVTGSDPSTDVRIYAAVENANSGTWRIVAFGLDEQSEPTVLWSSSFAADNIDGEIADIVLQWCDGAQGVAVIDGATDSVIKQIGLPQGYQPEAMVSVEPESLVMVAAYSGGSDSVFVIDVRRDSIRSAGRARVPAALAYSPRANVVYCANGSNSNNLSVIAADGSRVLSYVAVSAGPQSLLVCPPYEKLYVGHGGETNMLYIVRDRVGISEPDLPGLTPFAMPAVTLVGDRTFRYEGPGPASLVDACGRKARDIAVGSNDLSTLSPGVYVLVAGRGAAPRKVVKLR
jgi:DNA-binding beta-propeller fold protein YncE